MTAPALFLLAVDHRRSFEKLFGVDRPVSDADRLRLTSAKSLVVEAMAEVRAERAELAGHGLGVLIDDEYGADAMEAARRLGVLTAVAFERSGQAVLQFEHVDWRHRIANTGPTGIVKILVRHRADDQSDGHATQLARLLEISDVCTSHGVPFLLELLTPFTDAERAELSPEALELELRPRLLVDAIGEVNAAGIRADAWKVEGIGSVDRCAEVSARCREGGRDDVGVVVLGAGAPADTVNRWLAAAAAGGYSGFAVGRSIWADAVLDRDAGRIDVAEARRRIAANYLTFVDAFVAASSAHLR